VGKKARSFRPTHGRPMKEPGRLRASTLPPQMIRRSRRRPPLSDLRPAADRGIRRGTSRVTSCLTHGRDREAASPGAVGLRIAFWGLAQSGRVSGRYMWSQSSPRPCPEPPASTPWTLGSPRVGSGTRGFVDSLASMCGSGAVESTLARVGPTTPKSIEPGLLRRSDRRAQRF
jgi:hypothetical protein